MAAFVTGGLILLALAAWVFWAVRRIRRRKGGSPAPGDSPSRKAPKQTARDAPGRPAPRSQRSFLHNVPPRHRSRRGVFGQSTPWSAKRSAPIRLASLPYWQRTISGFPNAVKAMAP